jgi:peptidoglycan/LPS O-acetylase OafA/YrhL
VLLGVWLLGAALAVYEKEILVVARHVPLWLMWVCVAWSYVKWNEIAATLVGGLWVVPGSLAYLPLGLLFAIVIACHLSKNGPALQLDRWLGNISYPLFLVHGPVLLATGSALKASGIVLPFFGLVAVCFSCSLIVAQAVYMLVERPVLGMRKAIHSSRVPQRALP